MRRRTLLLPILLCALSGVAQAAVPPCSPCAGLIVSDLTNLADALAQPPRLEDEARLYVAWEHELTAPSPTAAVASIEGAGATPWLRLVFRTEAPLRQHLGRLESELAATAALVAEGGVGLHFQVIWRPDAIEGPENPTDYAFLLKRASVAITGAQPDARVVTEALALDEASLRAFYDQETAAYIEGVALTPGEPGELERAVRLLEELDPGRPVVVDAVDLPDPPGLALARAAEDSALGVAVTLFTADRLSAEDLRPLKVLAREFRGDLSFDPYTSPELDGAGWAFARGEDLALRLILAPDRPGSKVTIADPTLRSPELVDPETGEPTALFGISRGPDGVEFPLPEGQAVAVFRVERMSAAELEGLGGLDESVTVTDERQTPVEEILRRLQAFEDRQDRILDHYSALNTTHLRFQAGTGAGTVETTFEGEFFFLPDGGFDWAWQEFYVNGVRWRSKKIPEIPLIQPEKAATLPLAITFTKEYRYRLRGTEVLRGRDCWVVDFAPAVAVSESNSLFQGTVWVDREIHARVRTRAVQLGLVGDVTSNEETVDFSPVTADGAPAEWTAAAYFLPLRTVGQQIWSILGAATIVEREILLTDVRINDPAFEERRQAVLASESTMVRDTDEGLRYLVVNEETGEREVKEGIDMKRRFLVGGVFYDESQDYPIPLAGMNWLWLDWRGTGTQANVFFAGALASVAVTNPSIFDSRWELGFDAFALAIAGTDSISRDGREVPGEDVEFMAPNIDFKIGRPIGNFFKADLQYELAFVNYSRGSDTADDFVVPEDHLRHSFRLTGQYNRAGYRLRARGSYHLRSDWAEWGFSGNPEFDPADDQYVKWNLALGKTFHLKQFRKLGVELEYVGGNQLDRFSKYEFGTFSDIRVHGYRSDAVRAEEAYATHLRYGFEIGEVFRLGAVADLAWATDEASGLDNELLAGIGIDGTVVGPWQTLINVDVGFAVAGPDDSVGAFIAVLKLFD